jgi:DNA-directed RNA polymerase alpha subunit
MNELKEIENIISSCLVDKEVVALRESQDENYGVIWDTKKLAREIAEKYVPKSEVTKACMDTVDKAIDIVNNGNYTMFLTTDMTEEYVLKVATIRKKMREEVVEKLEQFKAQMEGK